MMNIETIENMTAEEGNNRVSRGIGMLVSNFCSYHDGFSFTVGTELEAYKAAHKYNGLRSVVRQVPNIGAWLVQIYK